jgi:hypothetical protein
MNADTLSLSWVAFRGRNDVIIPSTRLRVYENILDDDWARDMLRNSEWEFTAFAVGLLWIQLVIWFDQLMQIAIGAC